MGSFCPLWYAALSLPVALSIMHCVNACIFVMHSRDVSNPKESCLQDTAYRRPYEVLLLCRPASSAQQAAVIPVHTAADHPGSLNQEQSQSDVCLPGPDSSALPSGKAGAVGMTVLSERLHDLVIAAVPGQHSRKPHLGRLLAQHLPPCPHCLEVEL